MKKTLTRFPRLLCFLSFMLAFFAGYGQFEGKVIYDVAYSSDDPDLASLARHFPKESELFINGANSRFQQNVSGGGQQIFINNEDDNKNILVMRFLGESFKVVLTRQNLAMLEENISFKAVPSGKTKDILGVKCLQAIAVVGNDTLSVYYSPELYTGNMLPQFKSVQGLVLEYETIQDGLYTHFKAREMHSETVAMDRFDIPDIIREISFEDFAKNFAYKKDS